MRRSSLLALLVVASLCVLVPLRASACPAPKDNPPHFDDALGAPVYTKADKEITVSKGQAFIVRLDSNPTTGFTWMLKDDAAPEGLELLGCKYTRTAVSPRVIGSGGVDSFAFRAQRSGSVKLELQHVRPWLPRPDGSDAEFSVSVADAEGQEDLKNGE